MSDETKENEKGCIGIWYMYQVKGKGNRVIEIITPSLLGMVAIVFVEQSLIVDMPLLNMMENLAQSSLLMDMGMNAISGA